MDGGTFRVAGLDGSEAESAPRPATARVAAFDGPEAPRPAGGEPGADRPARAADLGEPSHDGRESEQAAELTGAEPPLPGGGAVADLHEQSGGATASAAVADLAARIARVPARGPDRDEVRPRSGAWSRRAPTVEEAAESDAAESDAAEENRGGRSRGGRRRGSTGGGGSRRAGRAAETESGSMSDGRPAARRSRYGPAELPPDADPIAVAKEICLRLLTDRARTRQELGQALRRKGVPDEAAESVLSRFGEVGLIDDAAFAGQWVRSRHNHRGLARRAIAMELRQKGVDDEVAKEALAGVDQESEEQQARMLVDKKLRTMRVESSEQRVVAARRLVGMLARKGYGGGIAYGVVKTALAELGAESDELGGDGSI